MTDDSQNIAQDEIEALLREAQGGSAPAPAAEPEPTPAEEPPSPHQQPAESSSDAADDIDVLLAQAEQAIASIDQPNQAPDDAAPFKLRSLTGTPANTEHATLELIQDVDLDVHIELGRSMMRLEDILQLKRGSVVPLDRLAGDPVDVYVNGRLIARGEILVLNDNFCVRVGELVAGNKKAS